MSEKNSPPRDDLPGSGNHSDESAQPRGWARLLHTYPGASHTITEEQEESHHKAAPGDTLRVRTINTDNLTTCVWVSDTETRVLAIDGTDLNEPGLISDEKIRLAAGTHADLEVTVPPLKVRPASRPLVFPWCSAPQMQKRRRCQPRAENLIS